MRSISSTMNVSPDIKIGFESMNSLYSEKLKDPRWQQKRSDILARDNSRCTKCKSSKKRILHVHHIDYIPGIEPWEYPNDMLTTLCMDCHSQENERPVHEIYLLHNP